MTSRGNRKIHYVSKLYRGKDHDYNILKQEFPPEKGWFLDKKVLLDLGFQGFDHLYDASQIWLPHKRKRVKKGQDNSLTQEQRQENKVQSQARIGVEHRIGGLKRFRIIHNQIRIKLKYDIDMILGICTGLWNFLIC